MRSHPEHAPLPGTYSLTAHEHVEVSHRGPEALVAVVSYDPGGSLPPAHHHPHQDERFEVLAGALTVEVLGDRRTLCAGETLEIPRGTAHRMWNEDAALIARARWATSPPGRTEQWWAALDRARMDSGRAVPFRQLALLREYSDVFQIAIPRLLRPSTAPNR